MFYMHTTGVNKLVESSKCGDITSEDYSVAYEEIRDTVQKGFYINGTLMLSMMSNTVAGK
jgi:hypothetical protein